VSLLGEAFESGVCQKYAKDSKHSLFKSENRVLLRLPACNKYVSPEDLLAHLLQISVTSASTTYQHQFSSVTLALGCKVLRFEKKARAYAKATVLAGLHDVHIVSRAAGIVNEIVRNHAWYLQPRPGLQPFTVVDSISAKHEMSLLVVNDKQTSLEASNTDCSVSPLGTVIWLLQHARRFRDCRDIGFVLNGYFSYRSDFDQVRMLRMIDDA
jgi:hypothetical protein